MYRFGSAITVKIRSICVFATSWQQMDAELHVIPDDRPNNSVIAVMPNGRRDV